MRLTKSLKQVPRSLWLLGLMGGILLPAILHAQSSEQKPFFLKQGDRVVFYGDSITAQHLYTRFVEDFVVSRYPYKRIDFYNAGVSGDTVTGGYAGNMKVRLKRDVIPWDPNVVTIMLGMNDARYTTAFDSNFQAYKAGYVRLIGAVKADVPGVRLTLICPSPYDETTRVPLIPGYNNVLLRYGQFLSELGAKRGIPVVDFNGPMTDALRAGMKIDPRMAGSLLPDRIHPSPAGHWILAAALVRGWNIDPVVSSVTLDAAKTEVASQQNTTVNELSAMDSGLRWIQLDRALPLPLELNNRMTQFLLEISDIASLDRQMLRVTGLSAAAYTLKIDDKKIGTFSRQELAEGVNLALYSTPMEQQAKSIDWTAQDRAKLSGTRFDLLFEGDKIPGEADAVRVLDKLDQQMIDAEYKNAQPKPHTFALTEESR